MLARGQILDALHALDAELPADGVRGEICLYDGAVMCVAFDARPSTRDVDAVFAPAEAVRRAAGRVAESRSLPADWLNDAVRGFVVPHGRTVLLELPHLRVFMPAPDYLLAMKALAARVEGSDGADVRFLIRTLGLDTPEDVFAIVQKYYPQERIRPATRFFIEEVFGR